MEAFSLLKYWRNTVPSAVDGGGGGGPRDANGKPTTGAAEIGTTTTIVTAVNSETEDEDGEFFDLEFTVPDDNDDDDDNDDPEEELQQQLESEAEEGDESEESEAEREFNFALSSASSSNDRTDTNMAALSPSDDLFFKGKLVPIEPSEPNSKPPQFPVSLLKSATKLRVFMLSNLKKPKSNASATTTTQGKQPELQNTPKKKQETQQETKQSGGKFFTVKFKVEEVPIVSMFTRDNSSKNGNKKQNSEEPSCPDEKKFTKEVMQRYLKKVKPLYVRVSRRYGEKMRFSGQLTAAAEKTESRQGGGDSDCNDGTTKSCQKQGTLNAKLRVVCKHLGKSRSASSAVVAAQPPPTTGPPVLSKRRDDSLLQQEDGIQSAILHCKRSFNASRESESGLLARSVSDPSHDKAQVEFVKKVVY